MSHKKAMKTAPLMVGHSMGTDGGSGGTTSPHGRKHDGSGLTGAGNPLSGSSLPPRTVGNNAPGAGKVHKGNGLIGAPPVAPAPGVRGYKNGGKVKKGMC
jgi:hypothetical protein